MTPWNKGRLTRGSMAYRLLRVLQTCKPIPMTTMEMADICRAKEARGTLHATLIRLRRAGKVEPAGQRGRWRAK